LSPSAGTVRPSVAEYYTSSGFAPEQVKLFTIVFNAFVFMQVFNQINARKLEADELNVFSGMLGNLPFLAVMVVTIAVQCLMIAFGGRMVKCWPLNFSQNLLCILIGAGELPWGLLVKFIPLSIVPKISLEDKALLDGEKKVFLSTALKKKGGKTAPE
jgi:magnesium-transporting ATPase (P-type)